MHIGGLHGKDLIYIGDLTSSHSITSVNMEETPLMGIGGVGTNSSDSIGGIDVNLRDKRFIGESEGNSSDVHRRS
jgi:hypothetical protein